MSDKYGKAALSEVSGVLLSAGSFARFPGEIDDSPRLQRLFDAAKSRKQKVTLEPMKTYTCLTKLTIDMSYVRIDGNSAVLDFSSATVPVCINVIASVTPPYYHNHIGEINHLEVKGNRDGENVGISFDYDSPNVGVSHLDMTKVNVHGFNVGIEYKNHAYLIRHYSVDVWACNTCISMPTGAVDYGENISFYGCTFFNSTTNIYIDNPNGAFNFTACSFDYSQKFFDCKSGKIFVNTSHIEGKGVISVGEASGSLLNITDSWVLLLHTDVSTVKPFQINGTLNIKNCFLGGFSFGGQYQEIQSGTGRINISGSKGYNVAEYANQRYGAESAKVGKLFDIEASNGTGFNTNRYTRKNANIVFATTGMETGNSCVKFTKEYGTGSDSKFTLDIPVSTETFGLRVRMKATKEIPVDTLIVNRFYAAILPNGKVNTSEDGTSSYLSNLMMRSTTLGDARPAISTDWMWYDVSSSTLRKPSWATHIRLDFNAFYAVGPVDILIDRIEVYEY